MVLGVSRGAGKISHTGLSPTMATLSRVFCYSSGLSLLTGPHNPAVNKDRGLGWSPFARRYSGNHYCFLFLGLLRWFSSPRSRNPAYVFSRERHSITRARLPHSEISGSTVVCTSPKLIAAYHVLHRLSVPRHPPCALSNLTINLLLLRQTNESSP